MTSATLKKIASSNLTMINQFISAMTNRQSRTINNTKKAYAILALAEKIMDEAFDIEEVYNAHRLFDYAFDSSDLGNLLEQNPYLKFAKRNFQIGYKSKNLIKKGTLNIENANLLHHYLVDTMNRLKATLDEDHDVNEFVEYVDGSSATFIKAARNS